MRTLLITNDFPPIVSGISTYFYQLWRYLPQERVLVLAPKVEGGEEFDRGQSVRVIRKRIPIGESNGEKVIKTLLNVFWALYFVLKFRVTKLHCGQVISAGLAGLVCKRLFGIPYAVYVYGSETIRFSRSRPLITLIKKIAQEASEVVPNSEFTLKEYLRLGIPRQKMVKITPGVDTEAFVPDEKPRKLLEKYGIKDGRVLLTVGRLDERKGHDRVIEALPMVLEKFPDTRYLIVGQGREEGRLRELVKEMRLEERVVFAGYIPNGELPAHYNLGDVFVLPNRETEDFAQLRGDYEGFGIVFLEAGACAKPVIGGRSGGVEEAVVDGMTGILVDPRSAQEVAEAVMRLLGKQGMAMELGQEGRRRAQEFDWKKLSAKVLEILI